MLKNMNKSKYRFLSLFLIFIFILTGLNGCQKGSNINYSQKENWAYVEEIGTDKPADAFFICPTVYSGSENSFQMELTDEDTKANFLGATHMEKGIYDSESRFFAPYYRQVGLNVYQMPIADREKYLHKQIGDIKNAFEYYLKYYNQGKPIILAGFSQGAHLCIRLLKDCFQDADVNSQLIACYTIGWSITEEELQEYPHLKFASAEDDTGVIIAFNSEAENINDSLMIPKGTKTLSINPLN